MYCVPEQQQHHHPTQILSLLRWYQPKDGGANDGVATLWRRDRFLGGQLQLAAVVVMVFMSIESRRLGYLP